MGRATTTTVNLTQYDIKNGNQLRFEVRATDPAGNVGKSAKATPIVVDSTAPVPSRFTQISLTGVNDGKLQIIHAGKGGCEYCLTKLSLYVRVVLETEVVNVFDFLIIYFRFFQKKAK